MHSVSSQKENSKILEEKLEFLIADYEKYMLLQKAKFNTGFFEFLITTTADTIENAIKLRLGNLAKSLFKIKYNKIALTEKEMKAPGREIAYLSQVNSQFK
ncbi:MAG: hypothetical protein AB8G86_22535 [Saprospiraceae bacterium]